MPFIPITSAEREEMLKTVGVASCDALFADVPAHARFPHLDLPPSLTEMEAARHLADLASRNTPVEKLACFLGAGAYYHYIPAAVDHIISRSEFYTAYTPYQPEISQGTLQSMFEFQSLVCDLLGMDVANASMYDGSTALAEAVLMAQRLTRRDRVVVSGGVHPEYRQVLDTYLQGRDLVSVVSSVDLHNGEIRVGPVEELVDQETACAVVQQPDFFGSVQDLEPVASHVRAKGALLVIVVVEPISLGLLRSPGEWGADIAVAEGQALGVPLSLGGPWVGLMATRKQYVRQLPGRLVGATTDSQGRRGFVLTLQAREQHIRREKATSNICTSQTLLALAVTAYLSLMGPSGLRQAATLSHQKALYAAARIGELQGYRLLTPRPFFNEFAVSCPAPVSQLRDDLLARGILGGYELGRSYQCLEDAMLLCFTEMNSRQQIDDLVEALKEVAKAS